MVESNGENCTLITGASAGIGRAFALECAKRKMNLALVSLPGTSLPELADDIGKDWGVKVFIKEIDLTEKQAPQEVFDWAINNNLKINILINNAGIGASRSFESESLEDVDYMIHLNIRTVVLLTNLFIPELLKHTKAYILNMSSLCALLPTPYKSIYCSSKAFIYNFSRAIREELRHTGIKVSVILPAAIPTNKEVIERINTGGNLAKASTISADELAQQAMRKLFKEKAVIIPGSVTNIGVVIAKLIPRPIRIRLIANIVYKKDN